MKTTALLLSATLATVLLSGCGSGAVESSDNLKQLGLAITHYWEKNEKPPEKLDDIASLIGKEIEFMGQKMTIAKGKTMADVLKNPLTGANPGYEYVAPPADTIEKSKTPMIWQLRDGKRDESLPICYADGSVKKKDAS